MPARLAPASPLTVTTFTRTGVEIDAAVATNVPTTGQTVTIAAGISMQIINPAGTLAALTIVSPAAPVNVAGSVQKLQIVFTRAITTITWTAGSGTTFGGATRPATVALGAMLTFVWIQSLSQWFYVTAL